MGDRVLVWQSHSQSVAEAALSMGRFGGPLWRLGRTTRFRLSLGSAVSRRARGEKSGRERLLGVWIKAESLDRYLRQAVLAERDDALYGSVQAYRLATRWAQVLVSWHDDFGLDGEQRSRQTPRFGLRQGALKAFTNGDVLGVEDWTERVEGVEGFVEPPTSPWAIDEATARRIVGAS